MQPLLRIQTVPINLEYQVQRAALRQSTQRPTATVTRTRGRAEINTNPAKIKIDSYEMRASMGIKSAPRSVQENAEKGRQAGLEAIGNYAEQGTLLMNNRGEGNPIADIARSKTISSTETILAFIPSQRPEISVEGGTISFDYTMDELTYDWHVQVRPEFEYVPGEVRFTVTQYPQVVIEYIGSPMYVPPSADPDYVPPPSIDSIA